MQEIKKKLIDIPNEYKPVPFWSWNDKLEPQELIKQIRWMQKNGIGGFFMHARGGLKTEYMSEEWMNCIATCCDEAVELGMNAWGYDENGWPSGFAGGKLLEDEKNRDRYLEYSFGAFDAEADLSYLVDGEELIRVTEALAPGEYLNIYIRRSVSTVDILNPNVVEQFIGLTHEKYKEYFGDDFSKKFTGFFTDEPQFYRGGGTPYSPMLVAYFKKHYGEDVLEQLGLLFVEKKGFRTFRYRYWLAMQNLMLDSFAKQIYEWCEENKVQLTGHYIEENEMRFQVPFCGGIMPFYEYMHIPGIDWLTDETEFDLGARQVGSVAAQLGKKHVLTETFAGRGWNCSPHELRRIAGFQYANGVNFLCHHLMPYSEHGQRKRDYPSHFAPINPWVKEEFKDFNDYFTRLGYLLAAGDEVVNVAMLHPVRSVYFDYEHGESMDEQLRLAMRELSSRGVGFHFLDETLLEKYGFVDEDKIGCGKCSYDYLVIPRMLTMGKKTEKLLRKFVEAGGKVLLFDETPQYLEGEPYAYTYLKSNCTLQEIINKQPFYAHRTDHALYYAYREIDGKAFLFIQNASKTEAFTQKFTFADGSQSFIALNPVTLEEKRMSMNVTVLENEALLLFPTKEPVMEDGEKTEYELVFRDAKVEFEDNYLTIDEVCFSKDGVNYSEPIYVNALFRQLLEERFEGKIWLRYHFEIDTLPKSMKLMVEQDNRTEGRVNGHPVSFVENWEEDVTFWVTDITPYIRLGKNVYEISMNWHQSEETYYALFGENVTETLKNCISYEGEIESIYLQGKFGVYSSSGLTKYGKKSVCGRNFYIGKVPETINEPVTDGFPFFRGKLKMSQNIFLDSADTTLHVMGQFLTAKVWVNGNYVESLLFDRKVDVSSYARPGENQVEVEFTIGNRNLFGPLHQGKTGWLLCPWDFDVCDTPQDEKGNSNCRLHRFYFEKG